MSSDSILLVEDNPDDVVLAKRALKKSNILNEVIIASDGIEAIEFLENAKKDDLPGVILLDLNMPRMGGLEFLEKIREDDRYKQLPIVILSSTKENRDVCESYNPGANRYIQKPVDFEQFVKAIQTLGSTVLFSMYANRGKQM